MSTAKKTDQELLSIIVPSFREEKSIASTLNGLIKVLSLMSINYEAIVVIDGRVDRTYEIAKALKLPKVKVLLYEDNLGKGYAVRYGLSKASGSIVGFIDANGINPASLRMAYEHFKWYKADLVIASKRHPVSKISYPMPRRIVSAGYQLLIKILFNLEVKDTQVGLKLMSRRVLDAVLPNMQVNDFAFDIEMLALARQAGFKRIYETPVELELSTRKETSTVFSKGFFKSITKVFWDTLKVFYRVRLARLYAFRANQKKLDKSALAGPDGN